MIGKNVVKAQWRNRFFVFCLVGLILLPIFLILYKIYWLNFSISSLIPATEYEVNVSIQIDGHGDDIRINTYLPANDHRQKIENEANNSGEFDLQIEQEGKNRLLTWRHTAVQGRQILQYRYHVRAKGVRYQIPNSLLIPDSYPNELQIYLKEEKGIQSNSPLIAAELKNIFPEKEKNIYFVVNAIHRHLQDNFKNRNFSGFTDALTALKLKEASCNGKGRLFVAMARKMNIPARLVGGLILKNGTKKTSHQWVELFINGFWVPFDTINDHFAELPENFLTLYYGDKVLFKHSANINFKYFFKTIKRFVPRSETQKALQESNWSIANLYNVFERIGISQNLLKIILMIPLGALVTVFFRNVVGLETFGTFLPALIAAAARETGLFWGLIGFVIIILSVSFLRRLMDWMQLLHSPKMAIMLTFVVLIMLFITLLGVEAGLFELAHMSLFPIAILAITAERFAIIEEEQGWWDVSKITTSTLFVISACYVVMDSLFLQTLILAYPETLLLVIALNLWLGRWVGMRIMELIRFRRLIFNKELS